MEREEEMCTRLSRPLDFLYWGGYFGILGRGLSRDGMERGADGNQSIWEDGSERFERWEVYLFALIFDT